MKKIFKLSALMAVAAIGFTACSSDDVADERNAQFGSEGDGYVAFNIQLPVNNTGSTRANDEWQDGTADEFQVNDAVLVLFAGANEASATFYSAYNLNTTAFAKVGTETDGCTTEARLTAQLKSAEKDQNHIYAFVVINGTENGVTVSEPSTLQVGTTVVATDKTFADVSAMTLEAAKIGTSGKFLMTSAPNSDVAGGSSDPSSAKVSALAEIDITKIYNTAEEARSNPAAEIYVERAAAKIDVTANFSATTISGNTNVTFDSESFAWGLGNTAKTFYLSRQFDNTWLPYFNNACAEEDAAGVLVANQTAEVAANSKYRFVGPNAIHTGVYRTYWGKDPYYTGGYANSVNEGTGIYDKETLATTDYKYESEDFAYFTEHTLPSDKMTYANSSYVGIKVDLTVKKEDITYRDETHPAADVEEFYTIPAITGDDRVYDEQLLKEFVQDLVRALPAYDTWKAANASVVEDGTIDVTVDNSKVSKVATTVKFLDKENNEVSSFSTVATAYADMMETKPIYFYDKTAYYLVPIRHFNDAETPWTQLSKASAAYNDTYPTPETNRDQNYLGRYGVLRNNWYKLEVTGIRHIGKPEPVVPDDTPDDEVDKYISVKIHVMPWTIRRQPGIVL